MSTRKLLDKLKGILSAEHDAQQKKYKSLKKILKALRDEKAHLKKEIERVTDDDVVWFAPRRLGRLLRSLAVEGPPASPIDTGV